MSLRFAARLAVRVGGTLAAGGAAYASAVVATQYGYDPYQRLVAPVLLRYVDPESAHRLAVWTAAHGLAPRAPPQLRGHEANPAWDSGSAAALHTVVWDRPFLSPVGLAAGFDKNGEAVDGMLDLGFGHVEVGTVTPRPQAGNPRPRVFRLAEDRAIINRYGFNSQGADAVAARLEERRRVHTGQDAPPSPPLQPPPPSQPQQQQPPRRRRRHWFRAPWSPGIVGVNLGKNRDTPAETAADDYVAGMRRLGQYADYLVINVSSPNTPGLRELQGREALRALLKRVLDERDAMTWSACRFGRPPVLVKVAPDLTERDMRDIADTVRELGIDGIIVSNTTSQRPDTLRERDARTREQAGGLSGAPLRDASTHVLRRMYRLTHGKVPLVGVGGVECGADAYEKIRAGASLVQLYTAMVYDGPYVAMRVKSELAECLARDGFTSVHEAVGADNR